MVKTSAYLIICSMFFMGSVGLAEAKSSKHGAGKAHKTDSSAAGKATKTSVKFI